MAGEPWKQLDLQYPARGFVSIEPAGRWEDSMITGNGKIGALIPGHPIKDGIILSHERLFLPANEPRKPPSLGKHLNHIRQLILDGKSQEAIDFAFERGQKLGYPFIVWTDQYYYDYWLYTGDQEFLKKQVLPFMLEAVEFYEDFLVEGKDGKYMFIPSYSPEVGPAGLHPRSATINATMDVASVKALLRSLITLSERFELDPRRVARWKHMLKKMPRLLN